MNSVQYIQTNQPLSHKQLMKIKKIGRPLPDLNIQIKTVGRSRDFNRYFKRETSYDKFPWMCGCPKTNRFYCFVCLVYDVAKASQWTGEGVCDLQHLQDRALKHSHSPSHLNHLVDFNLLGADNPKEQLNTAYLHAIAGHNERVERNRQTLRRLITCLRFSGEFELPLHKYDSHGQGIFRGLLDFMSGSDYSWEGLNRAMILQEEGSESIRDELLDAIRRVCKEEIASQVKRARFVALVVEKVEDCRLVIILRYFLEEQVVERFWDVIQLDEYTAQSISNVVLRELGTLGVDTEKLIAQSSNIPFAVFGGVREAIKENYPNANFVHYYPHHFKTVLENAAFGKKRMNVFFAFLHVFQKFFSESSQRVAVLLEEVMQASLTWSGSTACNFKTDVVKQLYGKTELFRECLNKIIDTTRHGETISVASGLLTVLDSEDFEYFLEVIRPIVAHLEWFFEQVHSQGANGELVDKYMTELESRLSQHKIHEGEEEINLEVEEHDLVEDCTGPAPKRRRVEPELASKLSQDKIREGNDKISVEAEAHELDEACTATASNQKPTEPSEESSMIKIEIKDEEITETELLGQLIEAEYMRDDTYDALEMKVEIIDGEMSGIDVLASTSLSYEFSETDPLSQGEPSEVKIEIDEEMNSLASTSKLAGLEPDQVQELKDIAKGYRASLIKELKERYDFTGHLCAAALFRTDMFATESFTLNNPFPEATVEKVTDAYPFIDRTKLRTELTVLYGRTDLSSSSLLLLLTFMRRNNLQDGFSETYKLLEIVCTTLLGTEEVEKCSATLKTVEKLVTKCGSEQRLGALAMLSIEKSMVQSILDFDNKVINIFAESKDRLDFKYM